VWFPLLGQLRSYERSWWWHDLTAGLVLSALLVPAGMGYAEAAGLPAINGLYATIVPLVVYAAVGPSRVLVLGPDSSLAPLILAGIVPLAAGDPERAVALAGMLSILAGLLCVLAAVARFGFLADLLSLPVRYGYLNGIALTIIVSQLPRLVGFSVDADGAIETARRFADGVADGRVVGWAAVIGVASLVLILALQRLVPAVPGTLVAIVGATIAVAAFGLRDEGLALVGELPRGLPSFALPEVRRSDIGELLGPALGIALVSFADTSVLSRTFALRRGDHVDPNRELLALGVVNISSGLFRGFAVSSSQSRTPVAESAGARTQLTGLVGAIVVAGLIVAAPALFGDLPRPALAAVVIAASLRLVEVTGVARLAAVRRSEFVISMATLVGVLVLGVIPGIAAAVALSVLNFLRLAWRPHAAELVRVDGVKGYHDIARHPDGRRVPGLLLFRFDAPLFFANAAVFTAELMRTVDALDPPPRRVVVTAEPITDIDATAADELVRVIDELGERGIEVGFAELKGHVRERFAAYGVLDRVPADLLFRTTGQAVHAHVAASGVEWVDWEDR
jgi:high affinity sulfate transporter 1